MEKIDDYPVSRVPLAARLPFLNIALVHIGMLTALDQFMLGAVLGHSMTPGQAFTAIAIGSLIFGTVTVVWAMRGCGKGCPAACWRGGADLAATPAVGWVAIIASIIGSVVGLNVEWGVPAFNSLAAASVLYVVLKKATRLP
ncbi:hypothetical protein AU490_11410 [Lonsdalea populi]|uniref:Uncharacterized protein n=2 Tax=Lonsdalea TaxID=1082702 RepID=A0ACD1JGL6_9GAMM|nr:hypothetical protein AU499_08935 [Lonsdalea populi]RAT14940.1 hypothetical protein AU485_05105 [Lonsdalea quercina]RAT15656.1 hypothetical protein AU486_09665 [Lonsdalea quercina]RAT19412.1 hypothetical protein AU487_11265 [Lonsdalea populi]RAT25377.1 hypothetical protein AU488_05580 [Lonsdalea populi]